jgi:hypothetical protein
MPLSSGFHERLNTDVTAAVSERHERELAADRAVRIRALAGVCAVERSRQWGELELADYRESLQDAARIIDALDALPVPARETGGGR